LFKTNFLEEFVKFRTLVLFAIILFVGNFFEASAQAADTVLGQFTNSPAESFAGGISGDGRFVVFESRGNLASVNPRNADNNREIFIFDYAQRRIFQITDTKAALTDPTKAATFDNVRVEIANIQPVISNDGRWIAFGSNATTANAVAPNLNPGTFDANAYNSTTGSGTTATITNPLTSDGNLEMWLYQIPATSSVNLSAGDELPVTDLSGGAFFQVTNTPASRLPTAGTTAALPFIANDNRDASINSNGDVIAFVSNRDLVAGANSATNNQNNDEIFTFVRSSNTIFQVTNTPRISDGNPIYNVTPTISGAGDRVAFAGNGNAPIAGMPAENNDHNQEVFYANLTAGAPVVNGGKQVTKTTQTNPGDLVNLWSFGSRMSRDGRYIAFDSYANLAGGGGANQTSFAVYVYEVISDTFRQIGPRSDADSGAQGGDITHYPTFSTDVDSAGVAQTALVFTTRQNINSSGTVPSNQADGLNQTAARPAQIYSHLLNVSAGATPASFVRLTNLPQSATGLVATTQAITSNSIRRTAFNLSLVEPGTGNPDLASEVFYLIRPDVASTPAGVTTTLFTGASRLEVSASPVPTPTASPSPTPQTPSKVQGLAPGMLALVTFTDGAPAITTARTAVGSLRRSLTLPIELSGVTVTINGVAAGIKSVSGRNIEFVVPPAIAVSATADSRYPVVINNNGTVIKGEIFIVPARPDVFTTLAVPGPGGQARVVNATNTVQTREPFLIRTLRYRGGRKVNSVLRLYLTGVNNITAANIRIRIGTTDIPAAQIVTNAVLAEPGVYTVDFTLPATLAGSGDQPIVVSVISGNTEYFGRLADTAPRISIL
jgi:uncharacterized protein (TIGR03437 family)